MYVIVGRGKLRREESSDPESDIDGMSLCNQVYAYVAMYVTTYI